VRAGAGTPIVSQAIAVGRPIAFLDPVVIASG